MNNELDKDLENLILKKLSTTKSIYISGSTINIGDKLWLNVGLNTALVDITFCEGNGNVITTHTLHSKKVLAKVKKMCKENDKRHLDAKIGRIISYLTDKVV